jgi:iron-sulfur cluster assembly accessory protein
MPTKSKSKPKKAAPKQLIDGEMLIGDVLNRLPESAQIMQDFGLHCTSCSVNVFEPLKMGAMSHGIEEEVVDEMIERINELANARKRAPDDGIYVTEFAATKIKEFAKAESKEGWGLRITAQDNKGKEPAYGMDFAEKAAKGDKKFEFHGVEIYVDSDSLENLLGAEVDFVETAYGSGFKISNPNFMGAKKNGCACGGHGDGNCGCGSSGGCGCGSH